jgi:hypothetical protein
MPVLLIAFPIPSERCFCLEDHSSADGFLLLSDPLAEANGKGYPNYRTEQFYPLLFTLVNGFDFICLDFVPPVFPESVF